MRKTYRVELTVEADEELGEEALIDLLHENPAFGDGSVELMEMACWQEDRPDELESEFYVCRWPNGDFSVVTAPTRKAAIIALDEWAGAHVSQLSPMEFFMADFRLTDEGEIELNEFSEATREAILDVCYPELRDVLAEDGLTAERVAAAVARERTRLWHDQPEDEPTTELGKRIALEMGTSAVVADHYAEEIVSRILESDAGENGKPN